MPLLLIFTVLLASQGSTASPFAFMAGRWTGTLTYLDYKDNSSRVELKTTLNASVTPDGVRYRFSYVEPNGKVVEGDDTLISPAAANGIVKIGADEWMMESVPTSSRVVLERMGDDAGKRARFVRTYAVTAQELRIETAVNYETGGSVIRNVYVLKRHE